jgi:flagellar motility protein MotE (MotC chaperone)
MRRLIFDFSEVNVWELAMNRKSLIRTSGWIVAILSFSAALTAAGVSSSTSQPKSETAKEPVDNQEFLDTQENPVRPQGPALDMPQEVLDMLNQRQRAVERREEAMRTEEARLLSLKKDIEQLLARQQLAKTGPNSKQKPVDAESAAKAAVDQVVKMYETMPPEEAAARLEKLPTDMALEVLRSLKGKTAGTILASVNPAKAAKLTERFLAAAPEKKANPIR